MYCSISELAPRWVAEVFCKLEPKPLNGNEGGIRLPPDCATFGILPKRENRGGD